MSINLKEATEFMLTNGYILALGKGKFKLSTKFHVEVKAALQPQVGMQIQGASTIAAPGMIVRGQLLHSQQWENEYKQFILDAKVPKRIDTKWGESYQANAYSEEGMKAFRKAIESGTDLQMMVRSTQLYYASKTRYKQSIGRYISEGTWKTDYDELLNAADGGEQTLIDHIKEETKNDEQSSYRLG